MYIRSNGIFSGIIGYKFVIVEMVGVKFSPNIVYLLSILLRELISFANLILSLSLLCTCTCVINLFGPA